MVRDILKLGHPVLRQKAEEVSPEELMSSETQNLIDDLIETMRAVSGAGLAAPQVGVSLRICVAEVRANPRYPQMPTIPLTIWVNPLIEQLSHEPIVTMYEGCLSVPGLRGRVTRAGHILVRSLGRNGEPQEDVFLGAAASVAGHEIDHLDGVLFTDRAELHTLTFLEEFAAFVPIEERLIVRGISRAD